jgi:hypothetical protein
MSDLTKLAIFALQYACALIGALIAVQLVLANGDEISASDQTPIASERHETWGPGRWSAHAEILNRRADR